MAEDDKEDELESGRMPLLDHLIELRKRLIYALLGFFAVFFVTFYFAKPIFLEDVGREHEATLGLRTVATARELSETRASDAALGAARHSRRS